MITHDTDKKFESRNGQSYDKTTVSLGGRARNTFVNMADFIVFIDIEKEKDGKSLVDNRYIYFRSDSDIEAGSRFENVPERIEYSAEGFLEVFDNAILGSYNDDEKAVEKAKKEQAKEREEETKEYRETVKEESNEAELIEQMDELIKRMTKDQQSKLKAVLKDSYKSVNYKKYDDVEMVQGAVDIAKSILG